MKFQKSKLIFLLLSALFAAQSLLSCSNQTYSTAFTPEETQKQLNYLLETQELDSKQRYAIINQIANTKLAEEDYQGAILLLTEWVEKNPDDMYNSYWL